MKLETKAKPVKIRILSGGEEHSSLDSLKKNFCIKDVKALMDGRLSRWLKQQNEENLAEEIEKFKPEDLDNHESCLNFIRTLFHKELKEYKIDSLYGLAKVWYKDNSPFRESGLFMFRHLQSSHIECAIKVYKSEKYREDDWVKIFKAFEEKGQINGEGCYILGKLLEPSGNEIKYMQKAAKLQYSEAIDYLKGLKGNRFDDVRTEFIEDLMNHFKNGVRTVSVHAIAAIDSFSLAAYRKNYRYRETELNEAKNEKEKEIINFIFDVKHIYEKSFYPSFDPECNILKQYENSILKYEAIYITAYINALFYSKDPSWSDLITFVKNKEILNKLKSIQSVYPPARDFLEGKGLSYHEKNGKTYVISDCIKKYQVIEKVLQNMFNYNTPLNEL
jgi:hypothetical protein